MENEKLIKLCNKITSETQSRLIADKLGCKSNLENAVAHFITGKKYIKIDTGGSGKYMVDKDNGNIYGIKAYGVINKKKCYGTLDTIDDYNWGIT